MVTIIFNFYLIQNVFFLFCAIVDDKTGRFIDSSSREGWPRGLMDKASDFESED